MVLEIESSLGEATCCTCCCIPFTLRTTLRHSRNINVSSFSAYTFQLIIAIFQEMRLTATYCLYLRSQVCGHMMCRALQPATCSAGPVAVPALLRKCTASSSTRANWTLAVAAHVKRTILRPPLEQTVFPTVHTGSSHYFNSPAYSIYSFRFHSS